MKTIFMTKEQWEKWDKALRSGEYKQACGVLHDPHSGGYCCLGVLQEVLSGEVETDCGEALGMPSLKWLQDNGIRFLSGTCEPTDGPWLEEAGEYAAALNDQGTDFITIADYIKNAVQFTY